MAIIRWQDPFALTPQRYWPSFFDDDFWPEEKEGLTVYEEDDNIVAQANVPGIPADKIDVTCENNQLTIKAESKETQEERNKKKAIYRQAREAKYYYSTSIPCPIKNDAVKAQVKDGVVTVTLPKAKGTETKKIKVESIE